MKMPTSSSSLIASMTLVSWSLLTSLRSASGFSLKQTLHRRYHVAGIAQTAKPSAQDDSSSTLFPRKSSSPVPITLLSGFLGTGKTTALKHLLENTENIKIGVIVNDVASVNIDAKFLSQQTSNGDMIELQNGCACCSLADELIFSVEKIVQGRNLDALVVELSGVADPVAIRNNWKMAPIEIRQLADISQVVTLVDSQTFGTDYMAWDVATDRPGWTDPGNEAHASHLKVSELLAEQIEAADLLLINKIDLATKEQVKIASKVARALNEKAQLEQVAFGKVSPTQLLGTKFRQEKTLAEKNDADDCTDPACTDDSHSHSHGHGHESHVAAAPAQASETAVCNEPACTDPTHSHSHSHDHDVAAATTADAACNDADCTDTSHSHSHHDHGTHVDALGITNFVYKATRPFHTQRLLRVLNLWPIPTKDVLDLEFLEETVTKAQDSRGGGAWTARNPFMGVLRSKGFCWFAPNQWGDSVIADPWRHDTAMFWSHAGRHMTVNTAGKWWATIPRKDLAKYFEADKKEEMEKILRDDFVTDEFGDRRQELVFIGIAMDEDAIRKALDDCLLTIDEFDKYRQQLRNYKDTVLTASSSRGLFGVGNTEFLDQQG